MRSLLNPAPLTAVLILALSAVVSGCTNTSSSPGQSPSPSSPGQSPSPSSFGPSTLPPLAEGPPLQDPVQSVSHNGFLRTRIVVAKRQVDVAGRKLWALTYNDRFMPPTLRIHPGDRMDLAMENGLNEYTNLHTHGLHVSPSGHSDNVFIHIDRGKTFHYSFQFPKSLRSGTYWYHAHPDMTSAQQVAGGMSGVLIVDGLQQYLPSDLRHLTEHVIALKDFQLEGNAAKTHNLHIRRPPTLRSMAS
jgi:suppressor of ftsI